MVPQQAYSRASSRAVSTELWRIYDGCCKQGRNRRERTERVLRAPAKREAQLPPELTTARSLVFLPPSPEGASIGSLKTREQGIGCRDRMRQAVLQAQSVAHGGVGLLSAVHSQRGGCAPLHNVKPHSLLTAAAPLSWGLDALLQLDEPAIGRSKLEGCVSILLSLVEASKSHPRISPPFESRYIPRDEV